MKERHWIALTTSIRHGQTILVLGSEIPDGSGGSHQPLDRLRAQLVSELQDEGRTCSGETLAAVAQQYEDDKSFGPGALRAAAAGFYRAAAPPTNLETYAALASLPFSLILTSSHDDAMAQCLRTANKAPTTERYHLRALDKRDNPEFVLSSSPETPVVFHLFGHSRDPASLVLSENDILDFMIAIASERPPLPNSLIRALQRAGQNFLFVGFGIKHWYLRLLLKVLLRGLGLSHTSSAIAAESLGELSTLDRQETVLFYERGTRIEVADTDVASFVAELVTRVGKEGAYLGRAPSGSTPRVFISYASEDAHLADLIFEAFRAARFEPWLDRSGLRAGDAWNRRIEEQLEASDFVVVLHTPALSRKTDSYVNKEIRLAEERGLRVRGPFLIPVRTDDLAPEQRVEELSKHHEHLLRRDQFQEDMSKLISSMSRDYQRRTR